MLHLYALIAEPCVLPPGAGIDGTPLRSIGVAPGLAAVASAHPERPTPGEDAILAHARVVDELSEVNEAVLPARFGGWYADEAALSGAVAARSAELLEALEHVRGCVEIGLRVVPGWHDGDAPASGSDYMRKRLSAVRDLERLAEDVHAAFSPLARDSTSQLLSSPQPGVSSTYLLGGADVEEFRRRVAEFASGRPELTVLCTGPWAAYSFGLVDAAG